MLRLLCALVFSAVLASTPAAAEPWYIYGQTRVPAMTAVDNPLPNANGLAGEVDELPYFVPLHCTLTITSMGVEAYGPNVGLFPWLGIGPAENAVALMTVLSSGGTAELRGFRAIVPGGEIVNVRLMNGSLFNRWTHAWYVNGDLECQ